MLWSTLRQSIWHTPVGGKGRSKTGRPSRRRPDQAAALTQGTPDFSQPLHIALARKDYPVCLESGIGD
jgi:hypothetical protein